jgi:acyl-CoA thioesterase FadM
MQTLGVPKVSSVSTNISCEFVRPSGRLGDYLHMVTEPVKIGAARFTTFS